MERFTYRENGKWRLRIGDTEHSGPQVDRLAAYEDAEEQGLLVKMPCKRGDKVWRICGPKGRKYVAERTVLSVAMCDAKKIEIFTNCFDWLGKTVFLTREEAEKALREMNQNG